MMASKKQKKNQTGRFSNSYFKENYVKSWSFLKESRNFIYTIIGIFLVFILVGFFVSPPGIIEQRILEFMKELLLKTEGMSQGELISFIFFNNLQASFFGMIFGVAFGIFSVVSTILNGYIVGYVSSMSMEVAGPKVLLNLVPHGIFELPALFISLGLGLKLGTFIFEKEKIETLKKYALESLRVFVFIVIPLLIIAAIIEGSLIFFAR